METKAPKCVPVVDDWTLSTSSEVLHFATANDLLKEIKSRLIKMHENGSRRISVGIQQNFKWVVAK